MNIKPKLSYQEQIEHLKAKGVLFNNISEQDALQYLKENNNFFKLSSYRKNFAKDISGQHYLHLDFSMLIDLAVIDMYLRSLVLKLSLNIEHFAKVNLMRKITIDSEEDGYSIVEDYFNTLSDRESSYIKMELERNAKSPYCKQAYKKYKQHLPVWVFIEIISFGTFISFYKFCGYRFLNRDREKQKQIYKENREQNIFQSQSAALKNIVDAIKSDKNMIRNFYLLLSVKTLRNASAHNNCIINDLREKSEIIKNRAPSQLVQSLYSIGCKQSTIENKLSNERISEIIFCLYLHKNIVHSSGVHKHLSKELRDLSNRFFQKNTYEKNLVIKSTFDVISLIIDKWF